MTEELNERILDKMVDGELNDEEQSRLLRACDEDPAQWRSLALAYVEGQTWRSDLLELREEWQDTKPEPTTANQDKPTPLKRPQGMPITRLLNVAAMLLLSLTIGFGIGALSFTSEADDPPMMADGSPSPEKNPADADDEILVLVRNQQTSELQPMKVPLVNISDIKTSLDGHHQLPPEIWRSLRNDGHDVSHQRQWYPVRLNDGRSALVPIDSFRVMFEGFQ